MSQTKRQLEETVALLRSEMTAEAARCRELQAQNQRLLECLTRADAQYRQLTSYIVKLRAWLSEHVR